MRKLLKNYLTLQTKIKKDSLMNIRIFTDGSCNTRTAPHFGGWSFAIAKHGSPDQVIHSDFGGAVETTNNRMELQAVIEALRYLKRLSGLYKDIGVEKVTIFSDSQYTVKSLANKAFQVYLWELDNWRTTTGTVANIDLLKEASNLLKELSFEVVFTWVKGHSGNYFNELVDKKANEGRVKFEKSATACN
jgi:ribonuclease HI